MFLFHEQCMVKHYFAELRGGVVSTVQYDATGSEFGSQPVHYFLCDVLSSILPFHHPSSSSRLAKTGIKPNLNITNQNQTLLGMTRMDRLF